MTNLTPSHATTTSTRRASRFDVLQFSDLMIIGFVLVAIPVIFWFYLSSTRTKEQMRAEFRATAHETETAEAEFLSDTLRKAEELPMIADAPSLTGLWRSEYDVSTFPDLVVRYDLNLTPDGAYTLSSLIHKSGLSEPFTVTTKGNYEIRGQVLRLTPAPGDHARPASPPGRMTLAWEKPESRDSLIVGTILLGGAGKNRFVRQ